MARPGELDFAQLAKEASAEIVKVDAAAKNAKVKVAASEGGVPAPNQATVDKAAFPDFEEETVEETVEPEIEETPETPEAEEKVTPNSEKSSEEKEQEVFDIPDTAKVKVKIDGEEQIISYKEYKDKLRKEATITQRMQNFAKSRDAFNAEVAKIVQALEAKEAALAAAQKPAIDPVQQALVDLLTGKAPKKERTPDEILTYGDVQAEQARLRQEFEDARKRDRAEIEAALAAAAQNVQTQAQANRERQQYLNGLDSILNKDEYKVLNEVIPNFKASIMFHVNSVAPENLEEALEASEDFVKERAAALKKLGIAKEQKQQAKAVKQKMESNDGATPTIAKGQQSQADKAKKYVGKNGKLDFKAILRDNLAAVNAMN